MFWKKKEEKKPREQKTYRIIYFANSKGERTFSLEYPLPELLPKFEIAWKILKKAYPKEERVFLDNTDMIDLKLVSYLYMFDEERNV